MDLLICGASARAAANSAIRAGLRPTAIDLFADRDLARMCPAQRIAPERWPADLIDAARRLPASPWIYTGGLENHSEIVDQVSDVHALCGNPGAVLRAVRDPFRVAEVLRDAGLACPAIAASPDAMAHGRWLVKPLASCGGAGIGFDNGVAERASVYYQQWIEGPSFSAVFVAGAEGTECAGVTRQLTGRTGAAFGYCGSIGPVALAPSAQEGVEQLGAVIARAFGLVGLFGVDFIVSDHVPWPVEVNPRYTASVEVLERATGRALLADHLRACAAARSCPLPPCGGGLRRGVASATAGARNPPPQPSPTRGEGATGHRALESVRRFVGKRIVFADRRSIFPALGPNVRLAAIADVPHGNTRFEPGDPVLTVFATSRTIDACAGRLERRSEAWLARLRAI